MKYKKLLLEGKVLARYPKAKLTTCGAKHHKKGCLIRLTNKPVECSEETNVLIDYDKNNKIVSIDLVYNSI